MGDLILINATNTDGRCIISGVSVFLENATLQFVILLVTEIYNAAGIMFTLEMLCIYQLLMSNGLFVELAMVLELDNKGAMDLSKNWRVGGLTQHIKVWMYFLCELKDEDLLIIKYITGEDNKAAIYTKNTAPSVFLKDSSL